MGRCCGCLGRGVRVAAPLDDDAFRLCVEDGERLDATAVIDLAPGAMSHAGQ